MDIATKIMNMRKERRLTQEDLGELLGVSYMTVRRWESRQSQPKLKHLNKIAELFNVPIESLARLCKDTDIITEDYQEMPITAGMNNNNIIITDWGNKRTYCFPNNDEGRKSLAQFVMCSAGIGSPVVSNTITGDNNSGNKQGIINN